MTECNPDPNSGQFRRDQIETRKQEFSPLFAVIGGQVDDCKVERHNDYMATLAITMNAVFDDYDHSDLKKINLLTKGMDAGLRVDQFRQTIFIDLDVNERAFHGRVSDLKPIDHQINLSFATLREMEAERNSLSLRDKKEICELNTSMFASGEPEYFLVPTSSDLADRLPRVLATNLDSKLVNKGQAIRTKITPEAERFVTDLFAQVKAAKIVITPRKILDSSPSDEGPVRNIRKAPDFLDIDRLKEAVIQSRSCPISVDYNSPGYQQGAILKVAGKKDIPFSIKREGETSGVVGIVDQINFAFDELGSGKGAKRAGEIGDVVMEEIHFRLTSAGFVAGNGQYNYFIIMPFHLPEEDGVVGTKWKGFRNVIGKVKPPLTDDHIKMADGIIKAVVFAAQQEIDRQYAASKSFDALPFAPKVNLEGRLPLQNEGRNRIQDIEEDPTYPPNRLHLRNTEHHRSDGQLR